MQVILAALGGGANETLTNETTKALREAELILGAGRLLESLGEEFSQNRVEAVRPEEILKAIQGSGKNAVVVYSGDTGFYSGARLLLPLLDRAGIPARVLPGLSSVQLMAARLGRPWQDWHLVSAHGLACDPVEAVCGGKSVLFLTGGRDTGPAQLCRKLTEAGLGALPAAVGENLSLPNERITRGTAEQLARGEFDTLAVLLAEAAPRRSPRTPGWPDDTFCRTKVPMTKQEVRSAVLAKLALAPGETAWDIGAGTGSVSVEMAYANGGAPVYAVECVPEACRLIRQNREALSAWNLHLVEGYAPEALEDLPAPDAVFIGGSRGRLAEILDRVFEKNPKARVCVSAIALETLEGAAAALRARGMEPEITQIAVSRTRAAGGLHLLMANNPVFLIAGNCL
ncbi:MAG: precorrin-6y C5,15-methyltransferase (decarboxylating) subunit CbiE [Eubacteriales bacterium]|nr:precorrin-6y C5,15-methyltransferase (decarboxylating) subunit CbiE [Eubacteriales bacterium]